MSTSVSPSCIVAFPNSRTYSSAPTRPPLNISVDMNNSTSLKVDRKPVPEGFLHGHLLGYKIIYGKNSEFVVKNFTKKAPNDTLSFLLGGLEEYTKYCVSVLAYTKNGDGKTSECVSVVTDEDGEVFFLSLYLIIIIIIIIIIIGIWSMIRSLDALTDKA